MSPIDPVYGRDTLVDLDGQLCVLHEVSLSSKPRIVRMWWPTGQRTAGIRASYGATVINARLKACGMSEHGYRFVDSALPALTICLKDAGRTEAIKIEEIDAPPPAPKSLRGKPYYWHNGQWWRELATGPQALGVML